jgi:hypothetical protein
MSASRYRLFFVSGPYERILSTIALALLEDLTIFPHHTVVYQGSSRYALLQLAPNQAYHFAVLALLCLETYRSSDDGVLG